MIESCEKYKGLLITIYFSKRDGLMEDYFYYYVIENPDTGLRINSKINSKIYKNKIECILACKAQIDSLEKRA